MCDAVWTGASYCASRPCNDNGLCVNNLQDSMYECHCNAAWTGSTCEQGTEDILLCIIYFMSSFICQYLPQAAAAALSKALA